MSQRDYYSKRTGKLLETPELTLHRLKRLFLLVYNKLEADGYFQKYLGYYCVDQGTVQGELGNDLDSILYVLLRKENLWPISEKVLGYTEADLFDLIEFLHDHCSKPISGTYHDWNNCGYHYHQFDDTEGQVLYRERVNSLLKDYQSGFELSVTGEILELPDKDMRQLLEAEIPTFDDDNVTKRIDRAVRKFRLHKSTAEERREALRDLADVLEYLRPQAKDVLLTQDEKDLFNLANNFGIRHHNQQQKSEYDKPIWHSWMFYYYLATIHALLRLIERKGS